jgi:DMSO/TMAO reductase YedYZ molybdopterin-dependent catalytic subunit
MLRRRISLALMLGAFAVAPLRAAEPPPPLVIAGPAHTAANITMAELAQLPMIQVNVSFLTERGTRSASFEGPLLWSVLERAGVMDPAKHGQQVSQTVMIEGRDGYRAVLALGEIAPEFEGKQVILAQRMDGQLLDPDHLRVVVPLDKRGGRSVRDVTRIEVSAPVAPQ